jgi:DNA gyrase/topoisomerase IV subunit A
VYIINKLGKLKNKVYQLNISRQIDTNFRNYALYVLENRGIPSFYDALTNVQRFIMLNAPTNYNKTISLVGSCISDGYHHGDKSLTGAINKLARPFGNSEQLLLGDGFFGSPIDSTAAAARYTSIKINPSVADLIRKNSFLNQKNEEGSWDPLWVDLPIGLTNPIMGIAVGYKTTVLPRSLTDMQKYLDGKIKEVKPAFKGFTGKVTRYKGMDKTWLLEGCVTFTDKPASARITDIPPMMKYGSFLKKLDSIVSRLSGNATIINNSSTNVDIVVNYSGAIEEWEYFRDELSRSIKMLVTETPVFVKDGLVLEYERVEDYIIDYRYRIAELRVRRLQYFLDVNSEEYLFQTLKEKYLLFMIERKKKGAYEEKEIDQFLEPLFASAPAELRDTIKRRINSILLRSLTEDELQRTREKIKNLAAEIEKQKAELAESTVIFEQMEDTSMKRATQNRSTKTVNLFVEDEIDGIEVFDGVEEEDEEKDADE